MDEIPRTSSPEWSAADAGKWIARVVIAVILAEAIWGFIVSVTNSLVLPLLARTMGGDVQSPLYLGKGDINVPALFASMLELCFAGIVAVILNAWLHRKPKVILRKVVRVTPVPARPAEPVASLPSVVPVQAAISVPPPVAPPAPSTTTSSTPVATPVPPPLSTQPWSPPEAPQAPAAPPAKAKPTKPKPPKEVYYNIVGEPLTPDDD
jgi:hypothetical protein